VVDVHRETDGPEPVTTLTLRPTSTWRGFRAGQFVQVGVEIDGARRTRCFSISSSAAAGTETFTITVRAHEDGLVSKHLATRARPGLVLHLSQAEGSFTLPDDLPDRLLLVSGGSGITPLMSMLRTLVDTEYSGRVTFLHYSQGPETTIFRDELEQLGQRANIEMVVVHTRHGGERFTPAELARIAPDHGSVATFACGPAGLIESIREAYVDSDLLQVEYFKTSTLQPDPDNAEGSVSFARAGRTGANTGATLLEQAEALGLTPEYGCRMGICFSCTSRKSEGTVRNVVTGSTSSLPDEDIQICVSQPVGDCVVDL
jgi:ferredoxin-NADP reductase